ncbi:RidA family protein [candidate division WWE3 bacterium]|uniref:RidA family protein n=1 Tax=candidate division WWE3 bacterium TaxID=2053526 RepID=A0A955RWV6_UNCKA|nr:RidA family protein [candidate division WWE3 bacterium]
MKKYFGSSEETGSFLSTAVEIDGLVYLSGQVHADADLKLHGETIEEKFIYTMQRIEEKLLIANLTKDNIVRVQIYIVDISELPALNKEYAKYFNHPMPVRTAVGVTALPLGATLEMDVIAAR